MITILDLIIGEFILAGKFKLRAFFYFFLLIFNLIGAKGNDIIHFKEVSFWRHLKCVSGPIASAMDRNLRLLKGSLLFRRFIFLAPKNNFLHIYIVTK
jgi:hypothetical protein